MNNLEQFQRVIRRNMDTEQEFNRLQVQLQNAYDLLETVRDECQRLPYTRWGTINDKAIDKFLEER